MTDTRETLGQIADRARAAKIEASRLPERLSLLDAATAFLEWHDEDPLGSGYRTRDLHVSDLRTAVEAARTPEGQMAAAVALVQQTDFSKASEEAIALFIDTMFRIIGRAAAAQEAKQSFRIRHAQENLEPQPPTDRGGWGAVRRVT